jgi:phospholipase C
MRKRILGILTASALNAACTSNNPNASPAADAGGDAAEDATTGPPADGGAPATGLQKLNHVVVIILENWSYDSLYAEFDGGDGLANALRAPPQTDVNGAVYDTLPMSEGHLAYATFPNAPFALDPYMGPGEDFTMDNTNNFYVEQQQIHGGKMDRFVALNAAKGLSMGYFEVGDLPLAAEAMNGTLCDHFFHGVFGGSLQNNMFLVAAQPAIFLDAGPSLYSTLDDAGNVVANRPLTPDGYVVGTLEPAANPHTVLTSGDAALPTVPPQTGVTIGDELSDKGVDWAWYAEGWNGAVAGDASPTTFNYHHQPFLYFAKYAEGTPARAAHLKDEAEFVAAASGQSGALPAVSFIKPDGEDNEHPLTTDVTAGEDHAEALINAVRNGPYWGDTAIIITYDENGGFWDHVPPPTSDRWGPGTRIPAIVISPYAKKHFVDSTVYDTASITALIEHRWGLAPLGTRDRDANDMSNAFDFSQ